jgi:hypothetical protein
VPAHGGARATGHENAQTPAKGAQMNFAIWNIGCTGFCSIASGLRVCVWNSVVVVKSASAHNRTAIRVPGARGTKIAPCHVPVHSSEVAAGLAGSARDIVFMFMPPDADAIVCPSRRAWCHVQDRTGASRVQGKEEIEKKDNLDTRDCREPFLLHAPLAPRKVSMTCANVSDRAPSSRSADPD